ncbi:hypothetical protein WOLCODRAFT_159320 [Wolfiporia cocos MD-104 SS10]|uniref:Uncharacterized protein n=1 Tax=Wolfiporia cocos (strain MD-104) TaxID=742152 RepID=A0A2H3JS98_WOLCO|nr:hypothetical protein WOLCODRAFT_159320 [Wolfiporia cocos MD-104 SS10]
MAVRCLVGVDRRLRGFVWVGSERERVPQSGEGTLKVVQDLSLSASARATGAVA